jgi:hypothetical protein
LLNDRWKQPGDEAYTNIPSVPAGNPNRININLPTIVPFGISPYEMYNNSDLRVADVDFIRCRQISLAYDLPQTLVKKIRSKRMNVGFSLANPFLVSFDDKWNGYDPETGGWPARRTASLSINLSL